MQPNTEDTKSINRIGRIFLLLGGLATLIVCGMIAGSITLDLIGTETTGKMTNISNDANRTDNSFTAEVTFTTEAGEEVSFISWHDVFFFELDERVKREDGSAYPGVTVRYLESMPKMAKVGFIYHAEYVNRAVWFFWSFVTLMVGVISLRNKPIVLDFSKRKK